MRNEEELKQSAQEWAVTFDSVRDLIMVVDSNFKIIRANQAVSVFLNLPQQEIIGKTCYQLFHGTQELPAICLFKKVKESKKREQAEMYLSEKNIWIEVLVDPILDERQELKEVVHIIRDITHRKKIESLLKESEENYRMIFNSANDAIFLHDLNSGAIFDVNQKMCQMYGYTLDEVLELNAGDLSEGKTPYSQKEAGELISKAVKGQPQLYEWRAKDKAGRIFWVEVSLKAVFVNENRKVMAVVRDITERKQTEDALRQRELSYRTLAENLPGIVYRIYVRENNRMQFFNKMLEVLTGYKEEELIRGEVCSIELLIFAQDRDTVIAEVNAAIQNNRSFTLEYRITHKDGTQRFFSERGKPVFDNQGLYCIDGIIQDCTERKKMEEALKNSEIMFKGIALASPVGLGIASNRSIQWVNDQLLRLVGRQKEEIIGHDSRIFYENDEGYNLVGNKFYADLKEKGSAAIEVNWKHNDGRTLNIFLTGVPLEQKDLSRGIVFAALDITERKKIEQSLAEKEQFFCGTLNDMYTFVAVLKPDGEIIFVNNTPLDITGLKIEEVKGKKFYEISWWTYSDESVQAIRKDIELCASGTSKNREIQVQTLKGFIWISFSIHPIYDESGNVKYIIPEGRDITARKRAEEALRETRDYLENLINYANAPIIVWDADFKITRFNRAFEHLTGYSVSEVIGQKLYMFFSEAMRDESMNIIELTAVGEYWESVEIPILCKDGNIRLVLWNSANIYSQDGEILLATIAQGMDITDRKKATDTLVESENKFRTIVENITDVFLSINFNGIILDVNENASNMLGYKREELVGAHLTIIDREKNRAVLMAAWAQVIQHKTDLFEREFTTKEGVLIPVVISSKVISEQTGGILNVFARDITERKNAELSLRASDENFRIITENSLVGIYIIRKDRFSYINPAMAGIFGYTVTEITEQRDVLDLVCPDDRSLILSRLLDPEGENAEAEHFVFRGLHKDRSIIYCDILGRHIFYRGQPAIIGTILDVTERKLIEDKLTELENFKSSVLDAIPHAVLGLRNRKIIFANSSVDKVFGWKPNELIGQDVQIIYRSQKDYEAIDELIYLKLASLEKTDISFNFYCRRKDEKDIFCRITVSFIGDSLQGKEIVAVYEDITANRLIEDALIKVSSAMEQIADSVIITNRQGIIEYVNHGFEKATGYSKAEVIGRKSAILKMHRADSSSYKELWASILSGSIFIAEFINTKKDGREYYTEKTIWPISDEKGNITHFVSIDRDITIRREMEKSQRFLQLGKLVGNMAHEVNNPLMVISGRAQLSLMEEIQNEDLKKNLQLIFQECLRAKDIIQRMLKFSRPSKGQMKETDINKCLEESINLVEHQFTLESITIKRDYGQSLPLLMVDEKQIQEVFVNLLNNSREAMSEGGAIEIKTVREEDGVRIDFKDFGSGMSPEVLVKLFEPFFTTKEKGTGLGLSVSYSIVKNYGGDLKFASFSGKGTTASIILPVKKGCGSA